MADGAPETACRRRRNTQVAIAAAGAGAVGAYMLMSSSYGQHVEQVGRDAVARESEKAERALAAVAKGIYTKATQAVEQLSLALCSAMGAGVAPTDHFQEAFGMEPADSLGKRRHLQNDEHDDPADEEQALVERLVRAHN